jgi:hypothetical protein
VSQKLPSLRSTGWARGGIEIRQFMRQRESVVFTLMFPVLLLLIFGSVFKTTIVPGVTFSQYFVAGMIASGLVNSGFQGLAIAIPIERDDGTLKRLRGTPMPAMAYFVGKVILVIVMTLAQIAMLLLIGVLLFHVRLPTDVHRWIDRLSCINAARHRFFECAEKRARCFCGRNANRAGSAIHKWRLLHFQSVAKVDAGLRVNLSASVDDTRDAIGLPASVLCLSRSRSLLGIGKDRSNSRHLARCRRRSCGQNLQVGARALSVDTQSAERRLDSPAKE